MVLIPTSTNAWGEDKGDQRQLSNDSSPARANGPENRHMSDGDGVCVGRWNIPTYLFLFQFKKNSHHFEDTQGRCAFGEKFGPKIIYLEGKYYRTTNVSFQSHDILDDKLIQPSAISSLT